MTLQDLPVVGPVLSFGPDDTLYDALILLGPVVLTVLWLGGRSPVTEAVATAYILGFVGVSGYRAAVGDGR